VSCSLVNSSAVVAPLAIPSPVIWSYSVGGVVFAIGLAVIVLRGDWQRARGFDELIFFGPLLYAALAPCPHKSSRDTQNRQAKAFPT